MAEPVGSAATPPGRALTQRLFQASLELVGKDDDDVSVDSDDPHSWGTECARDSWIFVSGSPRPWSRFYWDNPGVNVGLLRALFYWVAESSWPRAGTRPRADGPPNQAWRVIGLYLAPSTCICFFVSWAMSLFTFSVCTSHGSNGRWISLKSTGARFAFTTREDLTRA